MFVNTQAADAGQQEQDLPPELRHDGAGSRAIDVVIAIRAAHHARAFASTVTTHVQASSRLLTVTLKVAQFSDEYASIDQAFAVLRAFDIPRDRVASTHMFDVMWCHSGMTDDGLVVEVFALGPIDSEATS